MDESPPAKRHCVRGIVAAYWVTMACTSGHKAMLTRSCCCGLLFSFLLFATPNWLLAEPGGTVAPMKGDATRGQTLFNGKGICHYCHGVDGAIDKKPSLKPETVAAIAKQAASAPDLRNRAAQVLKDNKARFRAIREGHPGTGMFPDSTLSDQEITDILAYLAALRQSASVPSKSPY